MSSRKRRKHGLEEAIKYFSNGDFHLKNDISTAIRECTRREKYKGNNELQENLEILERSAETTGLNPEQIICLVEVVTTDLQAQTVNDRIIKTLVPASVVPDTAVVLCISALCTQKPALKTQCALLRWIIAVYEYIDTLENLHQLHGVIFHFLHYSTLMPYVCHLLYLLSRPEDMSRLDVRQLIKYQHTMGNQPYLTGLLSVYRHYFPRLVHVVAPRTYKSFFRHTTDRKMHERIQLVQSWTGVPPHIDELYDTALQERLQPPVSQGRHLTETSTYMSLSWRRRRDAIIPLPSSDATETRLTFDSAALSESPGRVPFVNIRSFKGLVDHLDRVEFPNQIGCVLRSNSLRHVMSYTRDPLAATRFQYWITETLYDELINRRFNVQNTDRVKELLKQLISFLNFLQEGIPGVDQVLSEYLTLWNGQDHSALILKLLTRTCIYSFVMLKSSVLDPLRQLFFTGSIYFKCKVVMCLTELLKNHAANEWPRIHEVTQGNSSRSLFRLDAGDCDGEEAISAFCSYVSRMILQAFLIHKHHALLQLCTLDFLDMVSGLYDVYDLPFVVLVEPRLIEYLLFSPHAITVSRVCSVLVRYRVNIEALKHQLKQEGSKSKLNSLRKVVLQFNQLIVDSYSSLWSGNAFNSKNKSSLFRHCPDDQRLTGHDVRGSLSIFQHPALIGFTLDYARDEDITDLSDIKGVRHHYLEYLKSRGLTGISQFVSTFTHNHNSSGSAAQQMQDTRISTVSQLDNRSMSRLDNRSMSRLDNRSWSHMDH